MKAVVYLLACLMISNSECFSSISTPTLRHYSTIGTISVSERSRRSKISQPFMKISSDEEVQSKLDAEAVTKKYGLEAGVSKLDH